MNLKVCLGILGLGVFLGLNLIWAGDGQAEQRAELGEKGKLQARASERGVSVHLHYSEKTGNGKKHKIPRLEILAGGVKVLALDGEESWFDWPKALAQIVEMDPSNPYPEIVFATFSGGAHCCNVMQIAVSSRDGKSWRRVDAGMYDGDVSGVEDANGDGIYELVTSDNRFLYAFSSYAGSLAPTQIKSLLDGKLVDVTRNALYRARLLKDHENIRSYMGDISKAFQKNGFLAGYVAQSALVGVGAQAWDFMLKHYDRKDDNGLSECEAGYNDQGKCKSPEIRFKDFPQALTVFLRKTGYLPTR